MGVRYVGKKPAAPLNRFIDDVYVLSGEPGHRRRLSVPPMPSAHLVFNLGDPVILHDAGGGSSPSVCDQGWFMGVWTRRFEIEYGDQVHVAAVHFAPWGLARFVSLPAGELRDRWVPADAIWGASVDRTRDRLATANSSAARLRVLEQELRSRFGELPRRDLELIQHTGRMLAETAGSTPVTALAERVGVSGNRLAGTYAAQIGIGPKRLARIYRFAHLMLSIDATEPVNWAELAHQVGYFDQPHLINEFKGFTGLTPSDYLAVRERLPQRAGFPLDMGPIPVE
jgi:AraC-like DNA-binding protein